MPAESWISADIYWGFLNWKSEARVSCLREWSNSKVQMMPYRKKKKKKKGRESITMSFKAWNKGPVWIAWTGHGSQNREVGSRSIRFTTFLAWNGSSCLINRKNGQFEVFPVGLYGPVRVSKPCSTPFWVSLSPPPWPWPWPLLHNALALLLSTYLLKSHPLSSKILNPKVLHKT